MISRGQILDVGSGLGDSAIYLTSKGYQVTALDHLTACPGQARIRLDCECQDKQVQPHVPQALCCYITSQPGAGRWCAGSASFKDALQIGEGLGNLGRQMVCRHCIAMEQVETRLVLACICCSLACSQAEAHRGCHAGRPRGARLQVLTPANPASKQADLLGLGSEFCNQQWDTALDSALLHCFPPDKQPQYLKELPRHVG